MIELGENEIGSNVKIQSINETNFLNPDQSSYKFDQDGELNGWMIEVQVRIRPLRKLKMERFIYNAKPFSENPWKIRFGAMISQWKKERLIN